MVKTASTMMELGTLAPDFSLPAISGNQISREQFAGKPVLLVFMCNHCPFVKHIAAELAKLNNDYADRGLAMVGISSNDVEKYPDDSFEKMKEEAASQGYTFEYLIDEDQSVAKAYRAACTPDFFLFDDAHKLVYRGQLDDSRPGNEKPVTGADLRAAIDALLTGNSISEEQKPSLGCNIKWIAGNEPDFFNPSGIR